MLSGFPAEVVVYDCAGVVLHSHEVGLGKNLTHIGRPAVAMRHGRTLRSIRQVDSVWLHPDGLPRVLSFAKSGTDNESSVFRQNPHGRQSGVTRGAFAISSLMQCLTKYYRLSSHRVTVHLGC